MKSKVPDDTDYYYKFIDGQKLEINILEYNEVAIEIKIINLSYNDQIHAKLKSIGFLSLMGLMYPIFLPWNLYFGVIFGIFLFILIYQIFYIVKQDSISFFGGFALQTCTTYFLDFKSPQFVPAIFLYDVIINEVISGFCIKCLLFARLHDENPDKDSEYAIKPMIQLLPAIHPGIDLLEIIYKHLKRKVEKSQETCE